MSRRISRRPIMAGNWKMNLLRADAEAFFRDLLPKLESAKPPVDVMLFPPALLIDTVIASVSGSSAAFITGAQDVHENTFGAHTGDLSAAQVKETGCTWALVGHSERRSEHFEPDDLIGRKAQTAIEHGLTPMICLGESSEQRTSGATFDVIQQQLEGALAPAIREGADFAIAYEPVWAIGSGLTATPELAQEAQSRIREMLVDMIGPRAEQIRVLYGGSAKPQNVAELFAQPDVDGFLAGGASLDSESFWAMISACAAG